MAATGVAAEIIKAAYGQQTTPGVIALSKMYATDFKGLKAELLNIAASRKASVVGDPAHKTNWTNPQGSAKQWALWTPDGYTEKDSYYTPANAYPPKAEFLRNTFRMVEFRCLQSVRLNSLGPRSRLGIHRENIVVNHDGQLRLRVRFHVPIVTNPLCESQLGDLCYPMAEGVFYYFNNGLPHASINDGDTERFHLVWDCLMTKKLQDLLEPASKFVCLNPRTRELPDSYPAESYTCDIETALKEVVIP